MEDTVRAADRLDGQRGAAGVSADDRADAVIRDYLGDDAFGDLGLGLGVADEQPDRMRAEEAALGVDLFNGDLDAFKGLSGIRRSGPCEPERNAG